jgi:hypothetical protein
MSGCLFEQHQRPRSATQVVRAVAETYLRLSSIAAHGPTAGQPSTCGHASLRQSHSSVEREPRRVILPERWRTPKPTGSRHSVVLSKAETELVADLHSPAHVALFFAPDRPGLVQAGLVRLERTQASPRVVTREHCQSMPGRTGVSVFDGVRGSSNAGQGRNPRSCGRRCNRSHSVGSHCCSRRRSRRRGRGS